MSIRFVLLTVALLLIPVSLIPAQDLVKEVKRGSKTISVYQDTQTNKTQVVVPPDSGWTHQLPPFQTGPTQYFQVMMGPRDVTVQLHRSPHQGQPPSAFITNFEGQMRQSFHDYRRDDVERIFGGRRIQSERLIPFFRTGVRGEVFAFTGIRKYRFQKKDAAGNVVGEEIKPDPNGKVIYNQIWVVSRQVGGRNFFYFYWISIPQTALDRNDRLNRPLLKSLAGLFESIRYID